jgi:hypothetical protein
MPRFSPYDLNLQINRMFEQGQSFFATMKVEDWLIPKNTKLAFSNSLLRPNPATKPRSASSSNAVMDSRLILGYFKS